MTRTRREAVRRRILETAMMVFERDGFTRANMAAIAAGAGLSAGGLYTHFESKEQLFLAAFAALVEQEEHALEVAILQSRDTASAIGLAIDYVAQVAASGAQGLRGAGANVLLHAWATAERDASLRELLLDRRAQASALALAVIEGAIARGELRPDLDVEALAIAVTSFLDGLFLQRAERGTAFTVDDAGRQAQAFFDAILRPVRKARARRPTTDRRRR